jgi:hypothetical protein
MFQKETASYDQLLIENLEQAQRLETRCVSEWMGECDASATRQA